MKIEDAVHEFLLSCQADNLSDATVRWYASILQEMVGLYGERDVEQIDTRDMRLYIVKLKKRDARYVDEKQKPLQKGGLSRDSVASHVVALHRFWKWASIEYEFDNPMKSIKRPKRPPRQPVCHPVRFRQALPCHHAHRHRQA